MKNSNPVSDKPVNGDSISFAEFQNRLNAICQVSEQTASAWTEWAKELESMDSGEYEAAEGTYKTQGMFLKELADRFDLVCQKYGVEAARKVISVADIPACLFPWEITRAGEYLAGGGDISKIPDMERDGTLEDFSDYPEATSAVMDADYSAEHHEEPDEDMSAPTMQM